MLRKWLYSLLAFFIIQIVWWIVPSKVFAEKVFQEDFNDGNINDWITIPDPDRRLCSSNWIVNSEGKLEIILNEPSCTTNIVPNDLAWDNLGENYSIDIDMVIGDGTDHNIAFKLNPSVPGSWCDVKFESPDRVLFEKLPPYHWSGTYQMPYVTVNGGLYHLHLEIRDGNFKLFINNNAVLDFLFVQAESRCPSGRVALRASTGGSTISKTWFDNLVVRSLDEATPTPTPTPIPEPSKIPIVLLPGIGGSWNTEALISGGDDGIWKKTPFVKVYDNFKQTFVNSGYIEGQNYFEFYYDWRKPLDNLADQLKNYLESTVLAGKSSNARVNLIGHSMGGLVARAYGQKYGENKIDRLITVGSPHQGAIPAYLAWAGAKVGEKWSWDWLALQLYLRLQKPRFNSPVTAIQAISPSLLDMTPTFDFAQKKNQIIPVTNMSFKNLYLASLNQNLTPELKNIFNLVYGEAGNETNEWLILGERRVVDKLMGKWPDGKPLQTINTNHGDLTVLSKSAILNDVQSIATIAASHRELINSNDGIQVIIDALDLTGITPITNVNSERKNPSLLFFLHSPAQIKVSTADGLEAGFGTAGTLPDTIYSQEDKLLLIQNALGNYKIEILGQDDGIYNLEIGQLTDLDDKWVTIENQINNGRIDVYNVSKTLIQPDNPVELAIFELNKIINSSNSNKLHKKTKAIIFKLNNLKQSQLTEIIEEIYELNTKIEDLDKAGKWLFDLFEKPTNKWQIIMARVKAREEIVTSENFLEGMEKILSRKIKGENPELGMRLLLAEEYLAKAKEDFEKGLYRRAGAEARVVRLVVRW